MREPGVPGSTRVFALCGVAAPIFYVTGTALAAALRTDYSVMSHTVSRLGEQGGPYALLFIYLGGVPYGLLTALFAIALYRALGPGAAVRVGAVLVAVSGIATVLALAVFPRDTAPAPPGAAHLSAGIVAGVASIAGFFVLASPLRRLGPGYRTYSLACGVVVLAIGFAAPLLGLFPGFGQRLAAAVGFAWMVAIALRILREGRAASAPFGSMRV